MLSRLKQKFVSKKHQRQNQVKVFNYKSDSEQQQHQQQQQQQQGEPQHGMQLTPWCTSIKDSSVDLMFNDAQQIKNGNQTLDCPSVHVEPLPTSMNQPLPPLPPASPILKAQQAPPPQTAKPNTKEEDRQRQEKATQWIQSNLIRNSTLPFYPSLERYEIIKKLGDGAFSDVYRARDKRTGQNVAIKVAQKYADDNPMIDLQHLHPNMKKKPRVTERANILKEVQIMRNVHHPNIVQLLQFTESRKNYFLVLDLCEGGELFHRIVDLTYFSEDLSRHIIGQLAQAVYHLHEECGVVHRDIKPENILFEPIPLIPSEQRKFHAFDDATKKDEGVFVKGVGGGGIGQVKLADFGLSKIIWDKDTLTPCGTVGYTAPEIVCDQKYSKGVDMWALGCVLYTMLCGFPPFYDESISALTRKVARGQFSFLSPWWDPISEDAKNLIQGLLCVDPRKRYTVRQVLQHPWLTGKKPALLPPARGPIDDTESIRIQAMRNAAVSSALKTSAADASPYPSMLSPILGNPGGMKGNDGNNDLHGENSNQRSPVTIVTDDSLSTLSDAGSSASSTRRKDVFSPGMATLKEIFDITAAVQRMAEEHTHHGDQVQNDDDDHRPDSINDRHDPLYPHEHPYHHRHYQGSRPTSKRQYNAQAAAHHQQRLAKITGTTMTPAAMATGTHLSPAHGQRRRKPGFDLNMNNATLLKNRRTKHLVTPCQ